jgi:hypothetical protein
VKYVNPFRSRSQEIITAFLLIAMAMISVGLGYSYSIEWFRDGKTQYLFISLGVLVLLWFWEANPFGAALSSYTILNWCLIGTPESGIVETLAIPAALGLGLEIHRRASPEAVSKLIAYLALLEASYAFLQYFGIEPFLNPKYLDPAFIGKPIGTLGEHMMLGCFIAMGSIYFFVHGKRWAFLICTAMVLVVGSSTAMIALMAAGLYGIFRWSPKAAAGLSIFSASSMLAGAVFFPTIEFFSFSGRLTVWPLAAKAWMRAPWFGHGPGSWSGFLPMWGADRASIGMDWVQVHNDWLQLCPELGIFGFLIVAAGVAALLYRAHRLPAHYGAWIVLLSVDSLGNFTMHMPTFGLAAAWLSVEVWNQFQGENYGRNQS